MEAVQTLYIQPLLSLDNNNKAHSNGYFDYVEGYTISNGRVFIPKVEPFGSYMRDYLVKRGVAADKAEKYAFTELYDSTKTVAKQMSLRGALRQPKDRGYFSWRSQRFLCRARRV